MDSSEYPFLLSLISLPGITHKKLDIIFSCFNKPSDVFNSSMREFLEIGIDSETTKRILNYKRDKTIEKQIIEMDKNKIRIITRKDKEYPENMKNIPGPFHLFIKGSIKKEDAKAVAMVGTRRASEYGKVVAMRLARELTDAGITIVSGMARGIDTYSHKGALEKGRTIAVLGSGVNVCYPPENKRLMNSIIENGAVISEYPPDTPPFSGNFPKRNRIISGISLLVIVVEARQGSGVLHTVKWALRQNRTVLAVPGAIYSPNSAVTNDLIKQGAYPVTSVEDVLSYLDIEYVKKEIPHLELDEMEVYQIVQTAPLHIDEIVERTGKSVSEISLLLMNLQMKGIIKELPGKRYTV